LFQLGLQQSQIGNPSKWDPHSAPSVKELAPHFPQLEITRLIGRGGMGAIYQARQNSLGRNVALKLLSQEVSGDDEFVERFEREARALAMLSHPNIVTVFDFGRTPNGLAYLIMEFVEGANLRQAISARRLTPSEAIELIVSIGKAIEYAHSKGVVHRDLKPENILLGEDGSAKVADFGIAKIVNDPYQRLTLTATRQVLGSPHYLAPEQLEAPDQVDHRIDLYAIGVVFYELLTGQLPLGMFEAPSHLVKEIDPRLDPIVLRLLQRNPAKRYQSVRDFLTDVRACSSTEPGTFQPSVASTSQPASVPFTAESHGGLAEAQGILQVTSTGILVEYIVVDAIFGSIKSELKQVEVPRERILRMSLSPGVFSSKLTIATNAMTVVSQLPGGESGQIKLVVKNADRELAEQVLQSLGFAGKTLPIDTKRWALSDYSPAQALSIMLCGLLNGGVLAVIITAILTMKPWSHPEFAIISLSVLFGLLILVQLLGGFVHLVSGLQAPWRVALVASSVPITPVVLVSFPIAVWWWYRTVSGSRVGHETRSPSTNAGWTATTLVYLRENRTARLISILNAIGIGMLFAGLTVYYTGWYPAVLRFRVISPMPASKNEEYPSALENRITQRLDSLGGTAVLVDSNLQRINVRCWKHQLAMVGQQLEIPKAPTLVFLSGDQPTQEELVQGNGRYRLLDVDGGLKVPGAKLSGAGFKVQCSVDEMTFDDRNVRSVFIEHDKEGNTQTALICQWSIQGREIFNQRVSEYSLPAGASGQRCVGLVIDNMVRAVAKLKEDSNQQLEFAISEGFTSSLAALRSAIRGPDLGLELEILQ